MTAGASTFTLRNRDFNTLSFRSNVVLRWEWRPGSTLFVVWQQSRAGSEVTGAHVGPRDMFRSLTRAGHQLLRHQDVVLVAGQLTATIRSGGVWHRWHGFRANGAVHASFAGSANMSSNTR